MLDTVRRWWDVGQAECSTFEYQELQLMITGPVGLFSFCLLLLDNTASPTIGITDQQSSRRPAGTARIVSGPGV